MPFQNRTALSRLSLAAFSTASFFCANQQTKRGCFTLDWAIELLLNCQTIRTSNKISLCKTPGRHPDEFHVFLHFKGKKDRFCNICIRLLCAVSMLACQHALAHKNEFFLLCFSCEKVAVLPNCLADSFTGHKQIQINQKKTTGTFGSP